VIWRPNCTVTLERPPTTRDATYNTLTGDWTAVAYQPGSPQVAQRWPAEKRDALPSRADAGDQAAPIEIGRILSRIRIRWRDDLDASMRVRVYQDSETVWQIIGGPAEVGLGRKRFIELLVEKYSTEANDAS
jgi:head-tail adaptor